MYLHQMVAMAAIVTIFQDLDPDINDLVRLVIPPQAIKMTGNGIMKMLLIQIILSKKFILLFILIHNQTFENHDI